MVCLFLLCPKTQCVKTHSILKMSLPSPLVKSVVYVSMFHIGRSLLYPNVKIRDKKGEKNYIASTLGVWASLSLTFGGAVGIFSVVCNHNFMYNMANIMGLLGFFLQMVSQILIN